MANLVKFVVFLCTAILLGLFTAQAVLDGRIRIFSEKSGPWRSWPAAGTPDADPYTKAHFLARRKLALSRFEVIEFESRRDDSRRALDGRCDYRLEGKMPTARWWSLTSYSKNADPALPSPQSISSFDTVYEQDSVLRVTVSNSARTGNWLKPSSTGAFMLVMRIYNPATLTDGTSYKGALLTIRREACR